MSVELQYIEVLGTRLVYRLRRSSRAKKLRMSVSQTHGLEVTMPATCRYREVQAFVVLRAQWAISHLQKLGLDPTEAVSEQPPQLPHQIHLRMIDQSWCVRYMSRPQGKVTLAEKPGRLILSRPNDDDRAAIQLLQVWAKRQAKQILEPRLAQLSQETGLQYSDLRIKSQRTRWGSYSYVGRVNLNYLLIFLPPIFADYVMLHELCHSKHANHSAAFWRLLDSYCADAKALDQRLQRIAKEIPLWAQYRVPVTQNQSVA